MGGSAIASTGSCIAVGCRSEADGETEIILCRQSDVDAGRPAAYSGILTTPSRQLAVNTALGTTILVLPVAGETTRVHVWLSHPAEPDVILIAAE